MEVRLARQVDFHYPCVVRTVDLFYVLTEVRVWQTDAVQTLSPAVVAHGTGGRKRGTIHVGTRVRVGGRHTAIGARARHWTAEQISLAVVVVPTRRLI